MYVNAVKRKKLTEVILEFMRGEIKIQEFRTKIFDECIDDRDMTLLEIAYKCMDDGYIRCDHYITVIKEDWHYWLQMVAILQTDKHVEVFRYHNPNPQKLKFLTIVFVGIALPIGLSIPPVIKNREYAPLLLVALMFSVLLAMLIAKLFNRKGNYKPNTELPYYWPYESEEEFRADYENIEKHSAGLEIPQFPPDLTGKVANVTNLLWTSPRPDE